MKLISFGCLNLSPIAESAPEEIVQSVTYGRNHFFQKIRQNRKSVVQNKKNSAKEHKHSATAEPIMFDAKERKNGIF